MQRFYFEYNGVKLHYLKYAGGNKILFAFHGYGQSASVFNELAEKWKDEYTIYSFDLFYHGRSIWNRQLGEITKEFIFNLFNSFCTKNEIDKYSLLAFSLGGKTALCLSELNPDKVEKLILIAPDGIKTSFWYNLATYPGPVRYLFKYIIFSPYLFYKLAYLLNFFKIIDKGIYKFVHSQMNTRSKRANVYNAWVIYRLLKPDLKIVTNNTKNILFELYLGKYDKIISAQKLKFFIKKNANLRLSILNSGHSNMIHSFVKH